MSIKMHINHSKNAVAMTTNKPVFYSAANDKMRDENGFEQDDHTLKHKRPSFFTRSARKY